MWDILTAPAGIPANLTDNMTKKARIEMKKILSLLLTLLVAASCSDTLNENGGSSSSDVSGPDGNGITLTITLPGFTHEEITRAEDTDAGLESLNVVAYREDGTFLSNKSISAWEPVAGTGNTYRVRVPVSPGAAMIHLVANAGSLSDSQCAAGLDNATVSGTINTAAPLCWGKISVSALMGTDPSVTLLRQFGKVKVEGPTDNSSPEFIDKETFSLDGYKLYKAASSGTIAPAEGNWNSATWEVTAPTLPSDASYDNTGISFTTGDIDFYESETKADLSFLIVKGKYKGKTGYYKVAFYDTDGNFINLLRNHAYMVKITYVNTYGWETEAEAAADPYPENRMRVVVKDDNPLVTKMIACKDYHLGVSDQVSGLWNAGTIGATIVTTIKSGEQPKVDFSGSSWITGIDWGETINVPEAEGSNSSAGKKYHITIHVDNNAYWEESRQGFVTVKSGDLACTITVTQAGKDFKRTDRTVRLVSSSDLGTEEEYADYFNKFLANTQGIKPEDMQQAIVRNDGLHFGVGTNTFSYLIPKKTGDKVTLGEKSDRFTVIEDGSNWKVTLNNTSVNNYNIWKGDFTISYTEDGHDISIKYPVYHCGIFHKIDENNQQTPVNENGMQQAKVSGRFYYGVVKVKGKTKTYVMLDRNLGASNDKSYAPDIKMLEDNRTAIGGYFKIATDKQSQTEAGNLISNLPIGFKIPENDVLQDLIDGESLKVVTRHTLAGEAYNSVEIQTCDDSVLPVIYLPASGYVEGESLKNATHANIWTRTLLSSHQGFDTTSPEFGFWYRYFDAYGKICTMSNLRFVSGSNGRNTGVYRAMPIRLIADI